MSNEYPIMVNYVSTYGAARRVAKFLSGVGWIIFVMCIIWASVALVMSISSGRGGFVLISLLPSLGGAVSGLLLVATGQITRATLDNADCNGEMLAIVKAKENIQDKPIKKTGAQLSSGKPADSFDPTKAEGPPEGHVGSGAF